MRSSGYISSISTVQRPTPLIETSRVISASSSIWSAAARVGTTPLSALCAIAWMVAAFAAEKPQARSSPGPKATIWGRRRKYRSGEILEPVNHGVTRFRGQLLVCDRPHQAFALPNRRHDHAGKLQRRRNGTPRSCRQGLMQIVSGCSGRSGSGKGTPSENIPFCSVMPACGFRKSSALRLLPSYRESRDFSWVKRGRMQGPTRFYF